MSASNPQEPKEITAWEDTWTFATRSDGDLIIDDQGRFATVHAENAVAQDRKVAIDTYMEEDPFDPEFGHDVFEAVRSNAKLKRELDRVLRYDDHRHARVKSVLDITINQVPGQREGATVELVIALDRPGMTITLTFDLFTGSLSING